MTARFATTCRECGNHIAEGTEITKRNNRWVHRNCPERVQQPTQPQEQRGEVENLEPTRNVREATMLANGRLDATIVRPDGEHVTLFVKCRKRNDGEGRRWLRADFAEATHVFVSAGKDSDTVATYYPPRGNFRAQGDPVRAAAAEELIRYLAEKGELNGGLLSADSCGRCGRRLTDPVSIGRGIGPECYGRSTGSRHVPLVQEESTEMASEQQMHDSDASRERQAGVAEAEARRTETLMADMEANADRQQTIRDNTREWAHDMAQAGDDTFWDALSDVDRAVRNGEPLGRITSAVREDELLADDIKRAVCDYARALGVLRNLGAVS